jgi:capsular exopolysaccharide synthesis family protein
LNIINQPVPPGGENSSLPERRRHPLVPADGYAPDYNVNQGDGLDLATIWGVLWERRFLILAATGAGLAVALIVSLLQTPLYQSSVTLELNPPTVPIMGNGANDEQGVVVPNTDASFLATQYGLLRSRALAEKVVENLNLLGVQEASDRGSAEVRLKAAASGLANTLEVEPIPSSRLVKLTFTHEKPQMAAGIVNGFATAFITSTLERRYAATATARDFLEERLKTVRKDLDVSEKKLVDYAQANDIITTGGVGETSDTSTSLQGASLEALNAALAEASQRRIAAEQRYRNMANVGSTAEVSERTSALRSERAKLQAELSEKSTFLKDDYPEMVRIRTRIDALNDAISSEAGNVSGSRATTLRSEYQAAVAEEGSIQGRVNQLKGAVVNLRQRSIPYNMLKRELDTNRSLYGALLERYNQIGVAGGVDIPQASIVDQGEVPGSPSSPNILLNVLIGTLLGLGLGAALSFALHYITDRISTPEDVREKLRLPPVGVIPRLQRKEKLKAVLADRKSPVSEAYSSLATTLQFTTSEGIPRTLLVTSTVAQEGKSTTSFVLARMLAQNGKRVLLMDVDLRKPSFVIEESADKGFSQIVIDGTDLARHIVKTAEDNLWLMPSGPIPPNPVQVLNSERAARVIREAREAFDCVIVDAPPAYGFADAPLLAAVCDAVLLVVESGRTRRRPAIEAIQRLRAAGALIVGVTLTKYRSQTSEYGYRYYKAYGEDHLPLEPHELAVGLISRPET